MKIKFVVPAFNAEQNAEALISSLCQQSEIDHTAEKDSWAAVVVDDMSDDDTFKAFHTAALENDCSDDVQCVLNTEKKYALRNIVEEALASDDDTVIACLDGDDVLCNRSTVRLLHDVYKNGADVVWTSHKWNRGNLNISSSLPENVNPYHWRWVSSHLKTFRASLLKKINLANFKDMDGEWFKRGYDQALMLPLLYLAQKRVFLDEVCYQYNIDSCSIPYNQRNWCESQQLSTINMVRARGFIK